MIVLWLIVWLICGLPAITVTPMLGGWALSLLLCAVIHLAPAGD